MVKSGFSASKHQLLIVAVLGLSAATASLWYGGQHLRGQMGPAGPECTQDSDCSAPKNKCVEGSCFRGEDFAAFEEKCTSLGHNFFLLEGCRNDDYEAFYQEPKIHALCQLVVCAERDDQSTYKSISECSDDAWHYNILYGDPEKNTSSVLEMSDYCTNTFNTPIGQGMWYDGNRPTYVSVVSQWGQNMGNGPMGDPMLVCDYFGNVCTTYTGLPRCGEEAGGTTIGCNSGYTNPLSPGQPVPMRLGGADACSVTADFDTSGTFSPSNPVSCANGSWQNPQVCGNGTVDTGEQCDDGNVADGDGCSASCVTEECGDGTVQAGLGEECDDGNTTSGDGCNASCATEVCGNGTVDSGEECDDGNTTDGDGCNASCETEYACNNGADDDGDGLIDAGDPGCYPCSECRKECLNNPASCATDGSNDYDPTIDTEEDCVPGNVAMGPVRSWLAQLFPSLLIAQNNEGCECGNGTLEEGEQCDDGDTTNGDGCNFECMIECNGDPSMCPPKNNTTVECPGNVCQYSCSQGAMCDSVCDQYDTVDENGNPGPDGKLSTQELAACASRGLGDTCNAVICVPGSTTNDPQCTGAIISRCASCSGPEDVKDNPGCVCTDPDNPNCTAQVCTSTGPCTGSNCQAGGPYPDTGACSNPCFDDPDTGQFDPSDPWDLNCYVLRDGKRVKRGYTEVELECVQSLGSEEYACKTKGAGGGFSGDTSGAGGGVSGTSGGDSGGGAVGGSGGSGSGGDSSGTSGGGTGGDTGDSGSGGDTDGTSGGDSGGDTDGTSGGDTGGSVGSSASSVSSVTSTLPPQCETGVCQNRQTCFDGGGRCFDVGFSCEEGDTNFETCCCIPADDDNPQHLACENNQCVLVDGDGNDECAGAFDCADATHLACVNKQCVSVDGAGKNTCGSDDDCLDDTHFGCLGDQCVQLPGAQGNTCSLDADCAPEGGGRLECIANQCVLTMSSGQSTCASAADCADDTHLGCENKQCVVLAGAGADTCSVDDDCTDQTHLVCEDEACVFAPGAGANECDTALDCGAQEHTECQNEQCVLVAGPGPNECDANIQCGTHSECQNSQCVVVAGAGENACANNTDCVADCPAGQGCIKADICFGANGQAGDACGPATDTVCCTAAPSSSSVRSSLVSSTASTLTSDSITTSAASLTSALSSSASVVSSSASSTPVAVASSEASSGQSGVSTSPSASLPADVASSSSSAFAVALSTPPTGGDDSASTGTRRPTVPTDDDDLTASGHFRCRNRSCIFVPVEGESTCATNADCDEPTLILGSIVCGDGIVNIGEECDDGNTTVGDGCDAACLLEVPEAVDEKPGIVASAPVCGNGRIERGEECDDGNRKSGDGCTESCQQELGVCGDGVVQTLLEEQCEQSTHDTSLPYDCVRCRFVSPFCGNGTVDPGEECDNGTDNSSEPDASCRPDCSIARCGDGILDSVEECDDGNRVPNDGCNGRCLLETEAGTGRVLAQEESIATQVGSEYYESTQSEPSVRQNVLPDQFNAWPFSVRFPNQPTTRNIPGQLPLAQLQPLVQGQAPVGDTGPAAVAVIGAGAAAGWSWMRRRKD